MPREAKEKQKMAKNWMANEAFEALQSGDKSARQDIARRFPLFATATPSEIIAALPENLTARKIEATMKEGVAPYDEEEVEVEVKAAPKAKPARKVKAKPVEIDEDEDEEEEEEVKPARKAKPAPKAKAKPARKAKAKPVEEDEDEDDDDDDFDL